MLLCPDRRYIVPVPGKSPKHIRFAMALGAFCEYLTNSVGLCWRQPPINLALNRDQVTDEAVRAFRFAPRIFPIRAAGHEC